jgi:SAM-dependent methyltransferase
MTDGAPNGPDANESFYDDIVYFNDPAYIRATIERNLASADYAGKDVLDLGCGAGEVAAFLAENGARTVHAVDIGAGNIAHGRHAYGHLEQLSFERADLDTASVPPDRYDLIWSDTVIELLSRPIEPFLADLHRALRPGGTLYISLTERTAFSALLYTVLRILRRCGLGFAIHALKYVARLRYVLAGTRVDAANFEAKSRYLFIPTIRLYARDEIVRLLEGAGFSIAYARSRINSDPNSPAHFEIRAEKPSGP